MRRSPNHCSAFANGRCRESQPAGFIHWKNGQLGVIGPQTNSQKLLSLRTAISETARSLCPAEITWELKIQKRKSDVGRGKPYIFLCRLALRANFRMKGTWALKGGCAAGNFHRKVQTLLLPFLADVRALTNERLKRERRILKASHSSTLPHFFCRAAHIKTFLWFNWWLADAQPLFLFKRHHKN